MKKSNSRGFSVVHTLFIIIVIALIAGIGIYVYHYHHEHHTASSGGSTSTGTAANAKWFIDAPALNGLLQYASTQSGGTALIQSMLDNPSTYVMTGTTGEPIPGDNSIPSGWNVTHAIITPDLAGVQQAANEHLPVVFDLETPAQPNDTQCGSKNNYPYPAPSADSCAQAHPGATFQQARQIMGSGTIIAAPGDNLAAVLDSTTYNEGNNRFGGMIALNVAAQIAPYVNGYIVQAQELEHTPIPGYSYQEFVSKVLSQAKAANPNLSVYSVLRSVSSGGLYDPPQELTTAAKSAQPDVNGYWLGISILPYPWVAPTSPRKGAQPNYSIPYQLLQSLKS